MTRHRLDRVSTPSARQVTLARHLRRNATPGERYAWSMLRNRQVLRLKFRRQHAIGRFIVDFYCPARRLVLELDGAPHEHHRQAGYDAARTEWLAARGYRVLRIRNRDLDRARLEQLLRPYAGRRG
ncbi:MAG: endonuclease domain-containing protein [Gemmatimonadales bacterium]